MDNKNFNNQLKKVQLLVSDVDGVLTDGTISISSSGEESKTFCVEDGTGVALAHYADLPIALLSGRYSESTSIRAKELKIDHCVQGFLNKKEKIHELCERFNVSLDNVAYIGDGLVDIPVLEIVGCPITVPNGHEYVKEKCMYISDKKGGGGVLYEIIELILLAQNRYHSIIDLMKKDVYKI
jgi:3-deoxy-D-manno-octulosonate 8-phosphate phosphatase (KDO 8-P phosphatase)